MADLSESSTFPSGIYQLEKSDPVVGGPPDLDAGEGLSNVQAQQLASRTRWLKDEIADRTAADALLAEIKTVDGAGSALDADTLDGLDSARFLRSDEDDTFDGNLSITGDLIIDPVGNAILIDSDDQSRVIIRGDQNGIPKLKMTMRTDGALNFLASNGAPGPQIEGNTIWHSGNDGPDSGMNADQLDGLDSGQFVRSDDETELDVGRGAVFIENHASDNQNGAGITLRPSSNPQDGSPGSTGAIFAIRSIGDLIRFWVGQSVTSTGSNDFETKQIAADGISLTGEIGASAWLRLTNQTDSIAYGQTFAGSALRTAGLGLITDGTNGNLKSSDTGGTPNGTWRAMGSCGAGTERYASTIFVRIS